MYTSHGRQGCLRSSLPSWSAKSTNPLLKMAPGAPEVRTLCSKWQLDYPSKNPLLEMAAGAQKVLNLWPRCRLKRPRYKPFARNDSWSTPKFEPFAQNGSWSAQSMNPLLEMAAGAPKVRTLCSKWQLERQKYEPFARNGTWSAQSTNPLLTLEAGIAKVRTLCSKWQLERKSIKPVAKMQVGAPKVQFEINALCFNLWVVLNHASTALLGGLARKVPVLTFVQKAFWKRFRKRFGKPIRKQFGKRCVGRQQRPTAR